MNKFITLLIILFIVACGGGFEQDVDGPIVTLLYPGEGFVASDSVEVRYEVSDNSQVFKMNLRLNGFEEIIMNTDLLSPHKFYYMLHVSEFESGSITIQGVAEDEFGNVGESSEVEIFIDNSLKFINISSGVFMDSGNQETEISYDYQMMTYPVTVGQYLVFLNEANENGVLTISGSKIRGNVSIDGNLRDFIGYGDSSTVHHLGAITFENNKFIAMDSSYIHHPITGVTLYGATAFAEYYKMRIPSILEWEKVARGIMGYTYPWGNENGSNRSNFDDSGDPWESGTTPAGYYNGTTYTYPDGFPNGQDQYSFATSESASPYGVYDMAGNIWEIVGDEFNNMNFKGGSFISNSSDLMSWKSYYCGDDLTCLNEIHS